MGRAPRGRSGGAPSAKARNAWRARIDREAAADILQREIDARRHGGLQVSGPASQGGKGRVGIVENWELRQDTKQDANSGAFKGLVFVFVALVLIVVVGWYAARPMVGPAVEGVFEDNPGIVNLPLVSDLLAAEFADRIDSPAGASERRSSSSSSRARPWRTSRPTSSMTACWPTNGLPLRRRARPRGPAHQARHLHHDAADHAGRHRCAPRGRPRPAHAHDSLDMRPGRRIEQTVAYLQQEGEGTDIEFEIDPNEFKRLARNPTKKLREQYPFLQQAPAGSTLEGFLYPATYEVPVDITAEELLNQMLQKWEERMGSYVSQARNKGCRLLRCADHRQPRRTRGQGGQGPGQDRRRLLEPTGQEGLQGPDQRPDAGRPHRRLRHRLHGARGSGSQAVGRVRLLGSAGPQRLLLGRSRS